jgi:hypothetical protein
MKKSKCSKPLPRYISKKEINIINNKIYNSILDSLARATLLQPVYIEDNIPKMLNLDRIFIVNDKAKDIVLGMLSKKKVITSNGNFADEGFYLQGLIDADYIVLDNNQRIDYSLIRDIVSGDKLRIERAYTKPIIKKLKIKFIIRDRKDIPNYIKRLAFTYKEL